MYHLAKSLYLYATSKEEYSILLLGLDNAGKTTLLSQIKSIYNTNTPDGHGGPSSTAGDTVPTVGQNVATITLPDMYLKIWDVGGQMSLRRLWQSYYKSAHAVVFVVDSSDVGEGDLTKLPGFADPLHGSTKKRAKTGEAEAEARKEEEEEEEEEEEANWGGSIPSTPPMTSGFSLQNFGRLDECRQVLESVLSHTDTAAVPILVLANKQDREDCVEVVRIKEGFVRRVFEGEKGAMVRDSRVLPVSALKGTGVREAVEWLRSRVLWNKEGRPPVMR